jgi:rhodanese-related sulfurtransferase
MPQDITRDDVRRLVDHQQALLVEVLPANEYDEEHLPGAINLPLKQLTRQTAAERLPRDRPVVVYCYDHQ